MHVYASTHKVHSVDTLHSDALAFLRIQAHSDAFTHTRIQPTVDTVEEEGDGEESDDDLDGIPCSGTWVLHWHAFWHARSPSSPYPSMFGLESARRLLCMCGPRVRRICAHLCAF